MRLRIIILILASALLAGCVARSGATNDGKVSVVASFFPIFEAAQKVGGDRVDVTNLTPVGAEPHDLELSPPQLDSLLGADVLLYMGRGFQPAVEEAAKGRHDGVTVDVLDAVADSLRGAQGQETLSGGLDPHVWLDPVLMGTIVSRVQQALTEADGEGAGTYEQNAQAYMAELTALDGRYRSGLTGCARTLVVTSHAAFGYLAGRYGLEQEAITGLDPEAEPDPKRLAELADLVREKGVTTIFTETLVSPRVAQTLAREVGVQTAVLDPLEGLTADEQKAGEDYVSIMDRNLGTLRMALGCP